MALIFALLFAVIVGGLVVTGSMTLRSHRAQTEINFRLNGQTVQFARAGLIDALAWFRKSKTQPVTAFNPQLDTAATPPVLETLDPDIGIVREFQISGPIWGRYEVWKKWDADPDPQRLAWRKQVQVEDISAAAGAAGAGNVWRINSVAYVYRLVDGSVGFDTAPNQVIATDIFSSEIRRLTLAPPGQAAVCVREAGKTTINGRVNLQGGLGAGIFHKSDTGLVTVQNSPTIKGSPGISGSASYDDSVEAVFGVSEQELRVLADSRITDPATFPSPVSRSSLYYVDVPALTFNAARPLVGTSVVYVKGNVTFDEGSKSLFGGLLFVDGDVTLGDPMEFNGTLVCTGTLNVVGRTDWTNLNYDDDVLNGLRIEIGQYRLSSAVHRKLTEE